MKTGWPQRSNVLKKIFITNELRICRIGRAAYGKSCH
jgi:hypothetical protein